MFRKLLILGIIMLMAIPFAGSTFAQDEDPEETPLRIGLMVDQSGGLSIYGYELEYGFKLGLLYEAGINPSDYESIDEALEDVRLAGRPVEILVRDNASDPETAATQARELIEVEGVEILVGAPSSGVTVGLQQVAEDYSVILFAAPGASPQITGEFFNLNTFRVCRNTFSDSAALGELAGTVGENWLILAADYEFGRASAGAFEATLPSYGVNFISETIYGPLDTTDFTPYLQEVLDADPDALLTVWAGDGSLTLFQQIEELGVSDDIAIVGGTNSNDIALLGTSPDQIGSFGYIVYHYALPENDVNDWLVEKHVEFFPNPATGETDYPDLFTGCSFATAQAMVLGVEEATEAALEADASLIEATLPEYMVPALEGLIFDSPKGTIGIRPSDHQALTPIYLIEIDNIDDPEFEFYNLLGTVDPVAAAPPCLLPEDLADRCEGDADFAQTLQEAIDAGSMDDGEMDDMEEEDEG
jgi:branched-chain amino acid transport system substrate-binding protein